MNAKGSYRADIDGLRAIAVLAVLGFHLDERWLPGGYIGVDVFFVISGYLITNLLRRDIASKELSLARFYKRRVRRLWPALAVMAAATAVMGYLVLLPEDLYSLSRSLVSQPIALQNMNFMIEGEYFRGSETKALLHTWSLGVEEQFYLIWPTFLLIVARWGKKGTFTLTLLVALGSFAFGALAAGFSPKSAFFLLPARGWQMCAGALLAVATEARPPTLHRAGLRELLSVLGLCLLLISFAWIDSTYVFPSRFSLPAVLGTSLLLELGRSPETGPLRSLLQHRSLVYVGRLSYSLYLWHWPVIVFARHFGYRPSDLKVAPIVVALSFALAMLSYHAIERPIRYRRIAKRSTSFGLLAASLAAFILIAGIVGLRTRGGDFRYSEPARSMLTAYADGQKERCGFWFRIRHPGATMCSIASPTAKRPGVLLWGNSHSDMWSTVLSKRAMATGTPLFLNSRNCRPLPDNAFCSEALQQGVIAEARARGVGAVVLASSWRGAYDIPDEELSHNLSVLLARLEEAGIRAFLVIDPPQSQSFDPVWQYQQAPSNPVSTSIPYAQYLEDRGRFERELFESFAAKSSTVEVLDPIPYLCLEDGLCHSGLDGEVWYRDSNHLTNAGARRALDAFSPVFDTPNPPAPAE